MLIHLHNAETKNVTLSQIYWNLICYNDKFIFVYIENYVCGNWGTKILKLNKYEKKKEMLKSLKITLK